MPAPPVRLPHVVSLLATADITDGFFLLVTLRYNTSLVQQQGAAGFIYGTGTSNPNPPFTLTMQTVGQASSHHSVKLQSVQCALRSAADTGN